MKKINKDLVIDFEDIIGGGDCPTYNNMDFYLSNEKRLRFKLNELNYEHFEGNIFYKCFDEETLEILKPMEWKILSKMSKDEMQQLIYKKNWDWLGDDFDDMDNYLNFVMTHKTTLAFSTKISDKDEYMDIFLHDFSDRFKTNAEKQAFIDGLNESCN